MSNESLNSRIQKFIQHSAFEIQHYLILPLTSLPTLGPLLSRTGA